MTAVREMPAGLKLQHIAFIHAAPTVLIPTLSPYPE
jgi:hypothetical protein